MCPNEGRESSIVLGLSCGSVRACSQFEEQTPARTRNSPRSAARDAAADLRAGALAGPSRRRLFHDGSVDHAWAGDVFTAFVIELHSRCAHVLGTTPYSDEAFVTQTLWEVMDYDASIVRDGRILICDRDPKWSRRFEQLLGMAGIRMVRTPASAPNCNAFAEGFVRSIKEECLKRIVPLAGRHLRRALAEYVTHYHGERNHQGLGNELIDRQSAQRTHEPVPRRQRIGGILTYDYRSAPSRSVRSSSGTLRRHQSNVEIASRKAAPKDLSRGGSDHPTKRTGEVCRIRETGGIRCIRHRRAARELTGTTLQTQPEYVRS